MTDSFKDELSLETSLINDLIEGYLPKEEGFHERIAQAMNYSIGAGGKRIRPIIMMESYKLCGGNDMKEVYPFMTAIEMIHTYSLVHDDLPAMDNDDYRRGNLTTHKKFGEDFGVLAGDGLLNLAYETMFHALLDCADTEIVNRRIKAAQCLSCKAGIYGMVGGQSLDVLLTGQPMNSDQLDYIFSLKTGALIEASFMMGGYLAGAGEEVIESLQQAGHLIGVAFQIKDDILDVTGSQEVLGKPVFSDEKNKKTTYVTLYGMQKAQKDVEDMSGLAIEILKNIGDNPFLEKIVESLIHRNM